MTDRQLQRNRSILGSIGLTQIRHITCAIAHACPKVPNSECSDRCPFRGRLDYVIFMARLGCVWVDSSCLLCHKYTDTLGYEFKASTHSKKMMKAHHRYFAPSEGVFMFFIVLNWILITHLAKHGGLDPLVTGFELFCTHGTWKKIRESR